MRNDNRTSINPFEDFMRESQEFSDEYARQCRRDAAFLKMLTFAVLAFSLLYTFVAN